MQRWFQWHLSASYRYSVFGQDQTLSLLVLGKKRMLAKIRHGPVMLLTLLQLQPVLLLIIKSPNHASHCIDKYSSYSLEYYFWISLLCIPGFSLWVGKIPWRREQLPTPVFLSGKSHGQRSLAGYSPWGCKESNVTEWLSVSLSHLYVYIHMCVCVCVCVCIHI